jgi:hypothetical protein
MEGVDFSFRAQVLEGDASGIEFGTDEDKGNVTMNVSLVGSTVTKIDKREVDITFRFLGYLFLCPRVSAQGTVRSVRYLPECPKLY